MFTAESSYRNYSRYQVALISAIPAAASVATFVYFYFQIGMDPMMLAAFPFAVLLVAFILFSVIKDSVCRIEVEEEMITHIDSEGQRTKLGFDQISEVTHLKNGQRSDELYIYSEKEGTLILLAWGFSSKDKLKVMKLLRDFKGSKGYTIKQTSNRRDVTEEYRQSSRRRDFAQ